MGMERGKDKEKETRERKREKGPFITFSE